MPASNRPPAITREDIAEIYDRRATLVMMFPKGRTIDQALTERRRLKDTAESYREIDRVEDDRSLLEHKHWTKEAWKQNRQRKIEATLKQHNERPSNTTILKVVK